MFFVFILAYMMMMMINLRFKRDAQREAMKNANKYVYNVGMPNHKDDLIYHHCSSWENLTYYNDMIYCKLYLNDHVVDQVLI
jgi:hypothetical protein